MQMEIPAGGIGRKTEIFVGTATLLFLTVASFADRNSPKPQPADYPAHVNAGNVQLAADYLVHSISGLNETFFARDYLVFEVAFYPERAESYKVDTGNFTLRVNGKKGVIFPESPGLVAASIKYQDANIHPHAEGSVGLGDVTATVGRPAPVPRFPVDPTGVPNRHRLPPRAPETTNSNVPKEQHATVEEVIQQTALEDGEHHSAICGYLFFGYQGNVRKIKSIELLYQGRDGPITLRLR
jgi:hypothetical protein